MQPLTDNTWWQAVYQTAVDSFHCLRAMLFYAEFKAHVPVNFNSPL